MSTAIALVQQGEYTPEQTRLITDVVAKGATPDELKLFLYRCKNMGLDPLKPGQVHFIKYGNSPGAIVVGIEGFRSIAERTGKKAGVKRGVLKEGGKLVGAWCEVYRSDWKEPAREEVPFDEYNTGKGPWQKMPETMIKKVAEAAALRMAFPDVLGGTYIKEEMDQAETRGVRPEQPGESDGAQGGVIVYKVDFGQWNSYSLEQLYADPKVGPERIKQYIEYLEKNAAKDKRPLTEKATRFIKEADLFLGAMENREIEEMHE